MKIRDRIRELRRVPASELLPNPKNWRTHPKAQQDALRGVLAEVGMADAVLARELPDGSLMLIDGHLRAETVADAVVPVLILDVNESEADKLLATLDPLAAMAESDGEKLDALLRGVDTGNEALQKMLASTAESAGLYQELAADIRGDADEQDGDEGDTEDGDPPPSGVRMVQLFLDESSIVDFQEACAKLAASYGTSNVTDTVLEAVKRESASL